MGSTKQKPVIIVMMKWPAAGRCKTRLATNIGSGKAASIQIQLINHSIAVLQGLERKGLAEIQFAISGVSFKAAKRWASRQGLKNIFLQGEGDLGLRMKKQVLRVQKQQPNNSSGRTTILIGSDLPSLSQVDLIKAIEALKSHEIILGPCLDGGYWLLGLNEKLVNPVVNWPFYGIPWGTNNVLSQTILRAKQKGISHDLLLEKNDVDLIEDLSPWQG